MVGLLFFVVCHSPQILQPPENVLCAPLWVFKRVSPIVEAQRPVRQYPCVSVDGRMFVPLRHRRELGGGRSREQAPRFLSDQGRTEWRIFQQKSVERSIETAHTTGDRGPSRPKCLGVKSVACAQAVLL